jgi:hypothetical protein
LAAVWVPYIVVQMSGHRAADWKGRALDLRYRYVHVAKRKPVSPDPETLSIGDPLRTLGYIHKHVTERGEEPGYSDLEGTRTGVPAVILRDTPEARAGLAAITEALEGLENKLTAMLTPERAAAFLTSISTGQALLTA